MRKYSYTETMRKMQVDIPNPRHGIWCARNAEGIPVLITHQTIWGYNKTDGCYQYTDGNVEWDSTDKRALLRKKKKSWVRPLALDRESICARKPL